MLPKQKDLMQESSWDVLIILDACRYDIYKELYPYILPESGPLLAANSEVTETMAWLNHKFSESRMDETIYISGHPYINSRDKTLYRHSMGFKGRDHFKKVVDAWLHSWDKKLNTITPQELNLHAAAAMDIYQNHRFIIHYMQPHTPYITLGSTLEYFTFSYSDPHANKKTKTKLYKSLYTILGQARVWQLMKYAHIKTSWPLGKYYQEYGKDGILQAYIDNLELALKAVKQLIMQYPKKRFVITADHGEQLGEKGRYGHGGKMRPILYTVPWHEVGTL